LRERSEAAGGAAEATAAAERHAAARCHGCCGVRTLAASMAAGEALRCKEQLAVRTEARIELVAVARSTHGAPLHSSHYKCCMCCMFVAAFLRRYAKLTSAPVLWTSCASRAHAVKSLRILVARLRRRCAAGPWHSAPCAARSRAAAPPPPAAAMKFRASFSDVGVGWLEKRFLPAFEKAAPGKALELCILLTPDSVFLIHDAKASGGPEIHADFAVRFASKHASCARRAVLTARAPCAVCRLRLRFALLRPRARSAEACGAQMPELFDPETYKLVSAHNNKARRAGACQGSERCATPLRLLTWLPSRRSPSRWRPACCAACSRGLAPQTPSGAASAQRRVAALSCRSRLRPR